MKTIAFKSHSFLGALLCLVLSLPSMSMAQDQEATIKLDFIDQDSLKTITATVTSSSGPANEVEVKFFAKRLFGLLPLDKGVTTDESGQASVNFPLDLPGDEQSNVVVIAKIEDNDIYANTESEQSVKWGVVPIHSDKIEDRSLWASRGNAPFYLIITSNLILLGVWGTLIYIIAQLFKIRKSSSKNKEESAV